MKPSGKAGAGHKGPSGGKGAPTNARTAKAPQEVRIIGGHLRNSRLPVATVPGLRPTPDRVRETLFNWLGQDLTGWHCVDSFAGAGALGFEAASRGAARVEMLELAPQLVTSLAQSAQRLQVEQCVQVRWGDGVAHLAQLPPHSVDLVFLDPPFASDLLALALPLAARAAKPGGFVYAESAVAVDAAISAKMGLVQYRQVKAGQVFAQLFQRVAGT